ncbi:MAG TPA: hypothetical protein ENH85_00505 [Candidatus Scalindua sp.]|nr:hypothetical protein [Candidatus Scalindua sp.]
MEIIVKSTPKNWEEEKNGKRKYTTRKLDGKDTIEFVNTKTGDTFTRKWLTLGIEGEDIKFYFNV